VSPIVSRTSVTCGRIVRRDACRRVLAGDDEGALAGVRIGAVLHPAVLLAFVDGGARIRAGQRLMQKPV
jgi:hypothetical protein